MPGALHPRYPGCLLYTSGEDEARYEPNARGEVRYSAIKQVASGRFGVAQVAPGGGEQFHHVVQAGGIALSGSCLLYTSPRPI